jgi:hypothetical protein
MSSDFRPTTFSTTAGWAASLQAKALHNAESRVNTHSESRYITVRAGRQAVQITETNRVVKVAVLVVQDVHLHDERKHK